MTLNECRPSTPFVRFEDVQETHGEFVVTRGAHQLQLPPAFRIAKYLVTNRHFLEFVKGGAYQDDSLWAASPGARAAFLMADQQTMGPAAWPDLASSLDGKLDHPVSGICYLEAQAFVNWYNRNKPPQPGWLWALASEDFWEFAARGAAGLIYPWGDAFDTARCNSAERGIGAPSAVTLFESGASPYGCCDMAGNVWEFVTATDAGVDWCVLRGGSYKNSGTEVRSYLRLERVPTWHRAPDFGFRLVQIQSLGAISS